MMRPAAIRPRPGRGSVRVLAGLLLALALKNVGAGDTEQSPGDSPPEGASVVRNGNFEEADPVDPTRPAHWDLPDGLGITWADADPAHGKAIRMDTSVSEKAMVAQWKKMGLTQWDIPSPAGNAIAATYGLSYYSEAIPVKSGQAYRVSFDYKGPNGGGKVWVRAYGLFRGEMRRRYERIVNCRVPDQEWTRFDEVFEPTRLRPGVTEMKVMLYAFWPPGVYWFDNVRLEPVAADTPSP